MSLRRFLEALSQWSQWRVWLLVLGWAVLIFIASSQKGSDLPRIEIPHFDKIVHFGIFGMGGLLVTWALCCRPMPLRRAFILGVVLVSLYGAADEWRQLYTPGRSGADFYDWLADFAGAFVGSFFAPPIFLKGYDRTRSRCPDPGTLTEN